MSQERDPNLPVTEINPAIPHPARIYDYWLGGKDNFESDRVAAEQVISAVPEVRETARENRAFLGRAVRHIIADGVTQFLDIGTGIPTQGNTHEVAQAADPTARIVYVDNDPMVMVHARALMSSTEQGATAFIQADLREPDSILTHPRLLDTIDLDRPIAILLVAILMFVKDSEQPYDLVKRIADAAAPGSYLVLSHVSQDLLTQEAMERTLQVYNRASATMTMRTREEIIRLFDGFELLEPGVEKVYSWRPEGPVPNRPTAVYAGVGRKR
ncbi:SAM-dependent methyltransferase [Nonomuraea sp. NPDC048916]|uniref:SAM-dependent methyltransferase n=1 Tax=Nonomuraea sp. NPDC048916 TaxID=3154232 RepID=UPI0033C083BC